MLVHHLTIVFLDPFAIKAGRAEATRSLDPEVVQALLQEYAEPYSVGKYTIGGHAVLFENGYVVCPWLMPAKIQRAVSFATAVVKKTGCIMADLGCRKIIEPSELNHEPTAEELDDLVRNVRPDLLD